MSKHHVERCACGAILKTSIELDVGACLACLRTGECGEVPEPENVEDFEWEPQEVNR